LKTFDYETFLQLDGTDQVHNQVIFEVIRLGFYKSCCDIRFFDELSYALYKMRQGGNSQVKVKIQIEAVDMPEKLVFVETVKEEIRKLMLETDIVKDYGVENIRL